MSQKPLTVNTEIKKVGRSKFYRVYAVNPGNGREVALFNTRCTDLVSAEAWALDNEALVRIWVNSASVWSQLTTPTIIEVAADGTSKVIRPE